MSSKKKALMLGLLAVGGIGLAMSISDTEGAEEGGATQPRFGRMLGGDAPKGAPINYYIPPSPDVTFPAPASFDIKRFFMPTQPDIGRGAAGVSTSKKKTSTIKPYLYTGGAVKAGASTLAPWSKPKTVVPKQYFGGAVEPGHYTIAPTVVTKPSRGTVGTSKKRVSAKSASRARATARHTAARKARMSSKK